MANTAQAKKRARQAETHRARNAGQRTLMRSQIKKVRTAIAAKDKAGAQQAFREAASVIDRMVGKSWCTKTPPHVTRADLTSSCERWCNTSSRIKT